MKISKTFSIDCAHMLNLPYLSKCNNLHGHTYRITLTIVGSPNEENMVFDYTHFPKTLIHEMDHKFIVAGTDYRPLPDETVCQVKIGTWLATLPQTTVFVLDGYPASTAEMIAQYWFRRLQSTWALPEGTRLHSVKVKETEATEAEYGS